MPTVFERVRDIIVEESREESKRTGNPPVTEEQVLPDARLVDDLNFDSLAMMDILAAVETRFGFGKNGKPKEIPDDYLDDLTTPKAITDCLKRLGFEDE